MEAFALDILSVIFCCTAMPFDDVCTKYYSMNMKTFCCILSSTCDPASKMLGIKTVCCSYSTSFHGLAVDWIVQEIVKNQKINDHKQKE